MSSFTFSSGTDLFKPTSVDCLINGVIECDTLAGIFKDSEPFVPITLKEFLQ